MEKVRIEIIQADITEMKVDAIVNAANNALSGGGGVDWAIHRAAGIELQKACQALKGCETGQSKITNGFNLYATYIIHTVGPVWNNGTRDEIDLLKSCYQTVLQLASQNNIKTIAFPAISAGSYRFPFDKAFAIAYDTISNYLKLETEVAKVYLVFYSDADFKQAQRMIKKYDYGI
jgi:O-acetyl-ADP-ribose deacetylase